MLALGLAPSALASLADEQALAEKFAPVVRLVEQAEECGPGEPYDPLDVELLFDDEQTVALRGPWNRTDLVKIAPADTDLRDRYEYHLDFPGNPLDAGCDYERWARRLAAGSEPTVYAHVATEPAHLGKLALQYWFFFAFNDFNNTHEGDWEMIQLNFDAPDAAAALAREPALIGYSSHEGAEASTWDDDKLELVDGTHPVVYPGSGSHANKFNAALYLGSSAEAGVGCDDTRAPHRELRPVVKTIPSDPAAARAAFPWIVYEGRWGELQPAFFNAPTGPNLKGQWQKPITWSEESWRDRSYAVPTGGLFGTGATDLFCSGVERGSRGLIQLIRNPGLMLTLLGLLAALVAFVVVKATWTPVASRRVARRRSWGQILSASGWMYVRHAPLFLGLGLLLIPLTFVITFVQWLLLGGLGWVGLAGTGEEAGGSAFLAVVVGTMLALLGLGLVQAATAVALRELDEGREIGPLRAYAIAFLHLRPLLGAILVFVVMWAVLTSTAVLLPIAIWLAIRWCLIAPVVMLERTGASGGLRRSFQLVSRRWFRTASLVGISAAVALVLGPLLGALLIFTTNVPFAALNLIAGVVYAALLPFVALVTAYVYFDARVREELEPVADTSELPAEIELARG